MATWTRVANGSTAGNISMNVDIGIQSVTRTSNSNVSVVYGVRFIMASNNYTYNNVAAFCPKDSGNRYYAFGGNGKSHTNSGTWYYANSTSVSTTTNETCPFTINIPVSTTQTSASFEVGYGWNGHTPSQAGSSSITVSFPTGATAPTGLYCSVTGRTETTATLNGGYNSDGGASVTNVGYQYSTNGSNWANCASSVSGLSPNTTYYFRYYAGNSVGTSYSGNSSMTTYDYPKPTSMNNFTIGDGASVNLYNPLGRNVTLQILQVSTDTVLGTYSGTYNGIVNGEFKTTDAISRQYASIPISKTGIYYCKVTYGSITKILNDSNNHTYSIKQSDDEKPLFDSSYIIDIANDSHIDISGTNKFIAGHNSLSGTIKPMVPQKSATADYYSISASGLATVTKTYSESDQSFTLGNMVSNTFNITAIDKRGMSRTVTTNIDLVAYNNPGVTIAKITRQNGIGTKAVLAFTGVYTNWTGLLKTNSIQTIKYKIGASGTWTSLPNDATITSSDGVWTLNAVLNDDFAVASQYSLYLQISDLLETVEVGDYIISTADAFVWKDLANKRIGVNKKPDYELDVNGTINASSNVYAGNNVVGKIRNKPVASIGSDDANSNGWYKVASSTMNGYGNTDITFLVQDNYLERAKGMLNINMRSNNTDINCWALTWLSRDSGIYPGDAIIVINGMSWTLYFYRRQLRYGRVSFHLLSHTNIDGDDPQYSVNFYLNNTTKEATIPTATITSVDAITNMIYPVGAIYLSATPIDPGTLFGGTWTQLKSRYLYATSQTSGNMGKDNMSAHTGTFVTGTAITIDQMPVHSHSAWLNNGGAHIHNMWFGGGANSGTGAQIPIANSRFGQDNAGMTTGDHDHGGITVANNGSGWAHDHAVSYIALYVWQRIA